MEKEIAFKEGLVLNQYSDVSPDGQCSVLDGLEVYDGCLRPCEVTGDEIQLNGTLIYIHKMSEYVHYLYADKDTDELMYYDEKSGEAGWVNINEARSIKRICATGHLLSILRENNPLVYARWDGEKYNYTGTIEIPHVTFALEGEMEHKTYHLDNFTTTELREFNTNPVFKSQLIRQYTKRYKEETKTKGFVYPFFACAAFETYDGSYYKVGQPILLVPNTTGPKMYSIGYAQNNNGAAATGYTIVVSNVMKLQYKISGKDIKDSNLIKRLVIMASAPIAIETDKTNDDSVVADNTVQCEGRLLKKIKSIKNIVLPATSGPQPEPVVEIEEINQIAGKEYNRSTFNIPSYSVINNTAGVTVTSVPLVLKNKSGEEMSEAYINKSDSFTIVKAIECNALEYDKTITLELDEKTMDKILSGSNTESSLSFTKDMIKADDMYEYNGRVNLFGNTVIHEVSGYARERRSRIDTLGVSGNVNTYFKIKRDNVIKYILIDESVDMTQLDDRWIFTYNTNAESYIVRKNNKYKEFKLTDNATTGKLYCLHEGIDWTDWDKDVDWNTNQEAREDAEEKKNSIYTSKSDNPMVYTDAGYNQIGTGEVMKLSSMTKPLSEGQMGSYPMIAFCTDGNYALKVIQDGKIGTESVAGLFEDIIPMQPDICSNPESVTGTDEGIFFMTNKGLMLLKGNESILLSEKLNGADKDAVAIIMPEKTPATEDVFIERIIEELPLSAEEIKSADGASINLPENMDSTKRYMLDFAYNVSGWYEDNFVLTVKIGNNTIFNEKVNPFEGNTEVKIPKGLSDQEIRILVSDMTENLGMDEEGALIVDLWEYEEVIVEGKKDSNKFLDKCIPVWDYVNERVLLVAEGVDKAYGMHIKNGAFNEVRLKGKVKKVLNTFPFCCIQFEDNKLMIVNKPFAYETEERKSGILITKPLKLDFLLMKKIKEFALQGNFSGKQKVTLYGSNDLEHWKEIGSTERRRVGMIKGYWFKYWKFKIETNLTNSENISGIQVKYDIRKDGIFR